MSGKSSDWVKLYCDAYEDDKIIQAGVAAELLYWRSIMWCGKSMTDGRFTRRQVTIFGRSLNHLTTRIGRLVDTGLWTIQPDTGLYVVAAWSKYNASAEYITARRERDRIRKVQKRSTNVRADSERTPDASSPNVRAPYTDTASVRSPSGSDRTEAAAVPRSASGAARPRKIAVDEVGSDEDVEPLDVDPREYARQQIANGRAKNPAAGKPFPGFWRQPTRVGKPEPAPTMFADAMSKLDSLLDAGNGTE